jgi:hypothetical protein
LQFWHDGGASILWEFARRGDLRFALGTRSNFKMKRFLSRGAPVRIAEHGFYQ